MDPSKYIKLDSKFRYDRHVYDKGPGWDPELIVELLSKPGELETKGLNALSDVELEIFHHKMITIVSEAQEVWSSLSIADLAMSGDNSVSLFTPGGDLSVSSAGIHFHNLLNYAQIKFILKNYKNDPSVGVKEGDVFFFNNPVSGGVHAPDMFTAMPIFYEGELVSWAAVGAHQGENGSVSPGGYTPHATTRFEEGLQIHALKIGENYRLRQDVVDYMCSCVRNPFVLANDLRARMATCMRVESRVKREIEKRGAAVVAGSLRRLILWASQLARQRIANLNDGVYRSVLFLDTLGTVEGLARVPTTVIKKGDEMTILVQGVSPPNNVGPIHATWHLTRASTAVYLFAYFFLGLPANVGLFEPLTFLIEGPSMANSPVDVAHTEGTVVSAAVVQNLHVMGSKMLFDSEHRENVNTPFSRNVMVCTYLGTNLYGYRTTGLSFSGLAEGQGARIDGDGEHSTGFYWASCVDAGEVEDLDSRFPFMQLARGMMATDTHGFGMYRGGLDMLEIDIAYPEASVITSWGSCDVLSHNPGLFGGYWGTPNPRFIIKNTNMLELMEKGLAPALTHHDLVKNREIEGEYQFDQSMVPHRPFEPGDMAIHGAGGAGGYGDVLERPPEMVMKDVREGIVSDYVVKEIYKVAYDPETLDVDINLTSALRHKERESRKQRGKPFNEFIEGWLAKKPKDELLVHYGAWPEPNVPGYNKPFWGIYG